MVFGAYLVRQGIISAEQFVEATLRQQKSRPPLGELALRLGRLTLGQFNEIVTRQSVSTASFGQVAQQLGHLSESGLAELLTEQANRTQTMEEILIAMKAVDRKVVGEARRRFYAENPIAIAANNCLAEV